MEREVNNTAAGPYWLLCAGRNGRNRKKDLQQAPDVHVSAQTVRNGLCEEGYGALTTWSGTCAHTSALRRLALQKAATSLTFACCILQHDQFEGGSLTHPGLEPQTRTCPYVCWWRGSGLLWVGCVWMMKAFLLLTDTPIPRPNKHLYHPIHYCHRHHFHHRLFFNQFWEEIPYEITCCLIT